MSEIKYPEIEGFEDCKIIQCSPPGTASTLLFNILYGFISPTLPVDVGYGAKDENKHIVCTHDTDIDGFIKRFPETRLFFISSERHAQNKKNSQ